MLKFCSIITISFTSVSSHNAKGLPISLDVPPCLNVTPASLRKVTNTLLLVLSGTASFAWRPALRFFFAAIVDKRRKGIWWRKLASQYNLSSKTET